MGIKKPEESTHKCLNPNGCPWGMTVKNSMNTCTKCMDYFLKHSEWPEPITLGNNTFKSALDYIADSQMEPLAPKKIAKCNNPFGCPWKQKVFTEGYKKVLCSNCKAFTKVYGYYPQKNPEDMSKFKKYVGGGKQKKKRGPSLERRVWKRIGLHPNMNLKMECADFYLLEKMVAESGWTDSRQFMGNEKILDMMNDREEYLAHEFATYLDMALGGEIRHAAYKDEGKGYKGPRNFSPEMKSYLKSVLNVERDKAWDIWTRLRRRAPKKTLPLLQEAVRIFEGHWEGGAGGKMWGQIGRVALPYIEGKMSARSFVNLCWSLQHCNDFVFDKTYNISGLRRVLEIQASGWYDYDRNYGTDKGPRKNGTLLQYASPEVQVLWKRFKMEQHKPQGMDVPDWHGTGD
jgi:hypothetical protein